MTSLVFPVATSVFSRVCVVPRDCQATLALAHPTHSSVTWDGKHSLTHPHLSLWEPSPQPQSTIRLPLCPFANFHEYTVSCCSHVAWEQKATSFYICHWDSEITELSSVWGHPGPSAGAHHTAISTLLSCLEKQGPVTSPGSARWGLSSLSSVRECKTSVCRHVHRHIFSLEPSSLGGSPNPGDHFWTGISSYLKRCSNSVFWVPLGHSYWNSKDFSLM